MLRIATTINTLIMAPPVLSKEETARLHLHLEAKPEAHHKDLAKEYPETYSEGAIGKKKVEVEAVATSIS